MSLFEPYSTEMPVREEIGGQVEREHLGLSQRLGYAILLSAGYAEADFVTEAERDTVIARQKRIVLEEAAALRAALEGEAQAGADGGEDGGADEDQIEASGASTAGEVQDGTDPTSADSLSVEVPEAKVEEEEDLPGARWDVGLHLTRVEHADLTCIGGGTVEVTAAYQRPIYTEELTVALLAAEKYNRSSFQRRMEGWLARLSLRLKNKLPEYTYGLAQLKPLTARRLLASEVGSDPLPDRELLALLTNTCHSARLAEFYVDSLARKFAGSGSTDQVLERIIRTYNGASSETVHGMRYLDAVRGAYQLLVQAYDEFEMLSAPRDKAITCLDFRFASPEGGTDEGGGEYAFPYPVLAGLDTAAASPAEAAITYYIEQSTDEGPPSYRERMIVRRREWLTSELIRAGFSAERIRWADPEARLRLTRLCGHVQSRWGAVEVSPARSAAEPDEPSE